MKLSYRIGYFRYHNDEEFKKHLAFIKENKDIVDEISLFVEYSHRGYWPLEGQKEISGLLKKRILQYKEAGIKSVGINLLCTVGHLEEAWDLIESTPMQTMVGIDGKQSVGCMCINTDEFRKYISERYKILAESNPDFIWVDDDFRPQSHGVDFPCFCPSCIEKFNKYTGRCDTFKSLTSEILAQPKGDAAKLWNKFVTDSYTEIGKIISNAVHSVNSKIKMGEMTVEQASHSQWFEALDAVMGRPGGGCYNDDEPRKIVEKFLCVQNQLNYFPDYVTDVQYEFENFPYQELQKSKTVTEMETAYGIITGCNGLAFNVHNCFDNQGFMEIVRENKSFWNALEGISKNTKPKGIYCEDYKKIGPCFMSMGFPVTTDLSNKEVVILTKNMAEDSNNKQLEEILSGSVFVAGEALTVLEKRGFLKYCGAEIIKTWDNGIMEKYTENRLNGEFAGFLRNPYVNFDGTKTAVAALAPKEDAEVLSELYRLDGPKLGACTLLYENSIGGRVAVSTMLFTNALQFNATHTQLVNIFDWLYNGKMPLKINEYAKIAPVIKTDENGKSVVMLVNMSFDVAEKITAEIATDKYKYRILKKDGTFDVIDTETANGIMKIKLENMVPWKPYIFEIL